MGKAFEIGPEFSRMLSGARHPDLARIALEIARDASPDIDIESYLGWIDHLARRIRDRCSRDAAPSRLIAQIDWAMFVEEGFRGNREDYYDARNSYLNDVIDRKTGIPITLCILYRAIAERLGLDLPGVNLPAHFMLKLDGIGGPLFIDPFHGDLLDLKGCERRLSEIVQEDVHLREDQVAACPPSVVVARMLRNLKSIHLQGGDHASVLPVQKRLAALLAHEPREQRDLGLLHLQLGQLDEAVISLQEYLRTWPGEADAESINSLLTDARREISLRN